MSKRILFFILSFSMLFLPGCDNTRYTSEKTNENMINIKFSFWEPGIYRELENALQKIADQYEKEHPNVHIELISKPVESYFDWIKSCYIADDMPDIESSHSSALATQYKKGIIVDLTNVFNAESAYAPGKPWKDTFVKSKFHAANVDYKSSNCNIPLIGTELGIFYNKSIYDELGLSIPETWSQFMNNCEIIKKAGITPIVIPGQKAAATSWLEWEIGQALGIKRFLEDKNININNDNFLSAYEKHRAVLLGYMDASKDKSIQKLYKTVIEHYKDYFSYCEGASDLEESIAKAIFISGDAAHINTGAWDAKSFLENSEVNFEVGTFKFPEFTSEDTDYPGVRIISGTTQSLGVTTSVYKQEGKLEAVIDFLQYFTSKDVYQQFIDDTMEIPVVEGISLPAGLESFVYDGYPISAEYLSGISAEDMVAGIDYDLSDSFFKKVQAEAVELAEEYMSDNGLSREDNYYYEQTAGKNDLGEK